MTGATATGSRPAWASGAVLALPVVYFLAAAVILTVGRGLGLLPPR